MPRQIGSTYVWSGVFLSGSGRRGFDPTGGLLAGSDHIVAAVHCQSESIQSIVAADRALSTNAVDNHVDGMRIDWCNGGYVTLVEYRAKNEQYFRAFRKGQASCLLRVAARTFYW